MFSDPSSFSNPHNVVVDHVELHFSINPHTRSFSGKGVYHVRNLSGASELVLDTHSVSVKSSSHGFALVGSHDDTFGQALSVTLGDKEQHKKIELQWEVSESSKALCWLNKMQTEGNKLPMLYTQGQSILNRGLFPCQDTPSTKMTYSCAVTVPKEFNVAMSAEPRSNTASADGAHKIFHFEMPQKVPSYLIALIVGDIDSRRIGPRSVVWAEPTILDAAAHEFSDITEQYLQAGERLFGKYEWDEYNIAVIPFFPYGGMENPRLTFVSPTIIVGDKSLTNVIAHEIAHSWTGNLVTNCGWGEFWLNEGFTMYAERELVAEILGREQSDLQAYGGEVLLREEYRNLGEDNPITALRAKIDGIDPDDAYCQCAYEGGYLFLKHIEHLVGGRDAFVAFLKKYIAHFRWQSLTSAQFLDFLVAEFPALAGKRAQFDTILDSTGSKHVTWIDFSGCPLLKTVRSHGHDWLHSGTCAQAPLKDVDCICVLLDEIYEVPATPVSTEVVDRLNSAYNFSATHNAELALRFSKIILRSHAKTHYPLVERFLTRISKGKQKFQLPIYRVFKSINDADQLQLARKCYESTKDNIGGTVKNYIDRIMGW